MNCLVKPEFCWGKEFDEFLDSLNKKDRSKILAKIEMVEKIELSVSIRKEYVKKLEDNIYEIRAQTDEHWLRGCYFQVKGTKYYITHGFTKKKNKTPQKEIKRAKKIREIILDRLAGRRKP